MTTGTGKMIGRRDVIRWSAGLVGTALAPGIVPTSRLRARPALPNLVLIVADDLGYGDLSSFGRPDYRTPALDRMAEEGVRLTQAYAAAPVCSPTRVGLMTGRYPARTPVGLLEPLTSQPVGLAPSESVLASGLKRRGYRTALVGKWHLGLKPEHHPLRHGFDVFYGFLGPAADYTSHVGMRKTHDFFDGTKPVRTKGYLTDLFTDRAVEFVAGSRGTPFFLSLQYSAPHWPWQAAGDPPYPDSLRWRDGGSPGVFARMVGSLDEGVGRVLAALQGAGLARDTLVVFTSDNGGERFSNMGPFSRSKFTLFEGGIRVAAIARWPGVIPAATTSQQVAITMDWTATFLALAGARPALPLDGIDLLPHLSGSKPTFSRELHWRTIRQTKQKAMRSGDWKYLVSEEAGEQLFDLATDPGETRDRKPDQPATMRRLRDAHARWETAMVPPDRIPRDPTPGGPA